MFNLLMISSILISSTAFASDDIRLGQPIYGGTGCPRGSASLNLKDNSITVSFSQYLAKAGGTGGAIDRKSCNIAIPLHVPAHLSISLSPVNFKGNLSLPKGVEAKITSEAFFLTSNYFFSKNRFRSISKIFSGPAEENFSESLGLNPDEIKWSPCGIDTNIRLNTSILVGTNSKNEPAQISIENISEFKVLSRSCK